MATGYDYRLDFIPPDILKIENNSTELYEYVFPPHLPHPTLAVIGLVQAIGAVMPISEIQSRWFACVMTGATHLPSQSCMMDDIRSKRTIMEALYIKSRRHTLQTFWIEYMDKIASHIQAKPNLFKMLFTDPELALKCFLGPCLPAQYRLTGPGKWPGARQFIVSAMSRAFSPRHTRKHPTASISTSKTSEFQKTLESTTVTATHKSNDAGQQLPQHTNSNIATVSNSPRLSRFDPNGTIKRRWHPEWMTLTFYMVLFSFCCLAWMLAVLFDKAEHVLNFFEQTVGRYLPMTD